MLCDPKTHSMTNASWGGSPKLFYKLTYTTHKYEKQENIFFEL